MNLRKYCRISATVFSIVALAHLSRILNGWPMSVADLSIPIIVSWFGMIGPGVLAIWGFREARRQNFSTASDR